MRSGWPRPGRTLGTSDDRAPGHRRRRPDAGRCDPTCARRSRTRTPPGGPSPARRRCLTELGPELRRTAWWHEDWVGETVTGGAAAFDLACDRWRQLYRAALADQRGSRTAIVVDQRHASKRARRGARPVDARRRTSCGCCRTRTTSSGQSDFYTYRYFASEGFLPGYTFPRLPLAAYIPASGRSRHARRAIHPAAAVPGDQRVRPGGAHLPRGRAVRGRPASRSRWRRARRRGRRPQEARRCAGVRLPPRSAAPASTSARTAATRARRDARTG